MTKIKHPELKAASEYYFENFKDIKDELHINGLSPNNDDHIFNLIRNNKNIKRVIYYYYSQHEKEYIDKNFPQDILVLNTIILYNATRDIVYRCYLHAFICARR